jgi:hypothetical protein
MRDFSGRLQEVIKEVNSIREDVFCLPETKKKDHGTIVLDQFIISLA